MGINQNTNAPYFNLPRNNGVQASNTYPTANPTATPNRIFLNGKLTNNPINTQVPTITARRLKNDLP